MGEGRADALRIVVQGFPIVAAGRRRRQAIDDDQSSKIKGRSPFLSIGVDINEI